MKRVDLARVLPEKRVEDTLPSPSSEVATPEMPRGEHGGEHGGYLSTGNDMAHSGGVSGVLEVEAEKVLDLEEEPVLDCYDPGVQHDLEEKEEMEEEEEELAPLNIESRFEFSIYEEPQCEEHIRVKRKRKFDEEYRAKLWDYGQKEKAKGAEKISWAGFFPEGVSRKERNSVISLYKRMNDQFTRGREG